MIGKVTIPIIKNKFYYMADHSPPKDIHKAFFFNIDNDLAYEGFYEDFGPLSLSKIWKYINEVSKFLSDKAYSQNIFYHYTSPDFKKCTNSALLICAYQMVMMKKTAEEAFKPFEAIEFKAFRDASYGQCSYKCTILDCLKGLEYAMKIGWFDYKKFDLVEYQNYEKIENGDINWIVPNKLLAFSSPYDQGKDSYGNKLFTPKDYLPIFKKLGVTTVVRLNNQTYDAKEFQNNGINHYDLFFTDGTSPQKEIVEKFISVCEKQKGVIAVHCKAGLGRTGTLIGCYAIKHYHFHASEFIGWIRLCRPGSILGPQQYFMLQIEQWLKKQGQNSQIWKQVKLKLDEKDLQNQMKTLKVSCKISEEQKKIGLTGDMGQGNRLMEKKKSKNGQQKQLK